MNDSSLLSDVKLRLGLCSIIKKLLKLVPLGMLIGGPPCSSWVFINRATSKRSTRRVFGNCALKYVRDANTTLVIHESQLSFQCLLHFGTCWNTNCVPSTPVVSQLDSCLRCASTPAISHFCHYLLWAGFGCKDNHKMDIVGNASSSSVCAVAHGTATVVLDALLWIHAICSSCSATFALGLCLIVGCWVLFSYVKQMFVCIRFWWWHLIWTYLSLVGPQQFWFCSMCYLSPMGAHGHSSQKPTLCFGTVWPGVLVWHDNLSQSSCSNLYINYYISLCYNIIYIISIIYVMFYNMNLVMQCGVLLQHWLQY